MTDKLEQEQETKQAKPELSKQANSARNNRRKLLKGAVAVPIVMTLQSGAALARTSNLIGTVVDSGDAAVRDVGNGDQVVCLLPDYENQDQTNAPPFDLGEFPQGRLEHNKDESGDAISISQQANNCTNNNGIIVSAGSFASIESDINFTV